MTDKRDIFCDFAIFFRIKRKYMQDQSKNTECVKFFQNGLITDGTQPDSCGKFSFAKRSFETCAKSPQQFQCPLELQ